MKCCIAAACKHAVEISAGNGSTVRCLLIETNNNFYISDSRATGFFAKSSIMIISQGYTVAVGCQEGGYYGGT